MSLVPHKTLHPPCCVSVDWRKLKIAYGVGMASSGINFVNVVVKIGQIFLKIEVGGDRGLLFIRKQTECWFHKIACFFIHEGTSTHLTVATASTFRRGNAHIKQYLVKTYLQRHLLATFPWNYIHILQSTYNTHTHTQRAKTALFKDPVRTAQ